MFILKVDNSISIYLSPNYSSIITLFWKHSLCVLTKILHSFTSYTEEISLEKNKILSVEYTANEYVKMNDILQVLSVKTLTSLRLLSETTWCFVLRMNSSSLSFSPDLVSAKRWGDWLRKVSLCIKCMWTAGLPRVLQGMITSQGEQLSNSMERLLIFSLSIPPLRV